MWFCSVFPSTSVQYAIRIILITNVFTAGYSDEVGEHLRPVSEISCP